MEHAARVLVMKNRKVGAQNMKNAKNGSGRTIGAPGINSGWISGVEVADI